MRPDETISTLQAADVATALGYDPEMAEALGASATLALIPGERTAVFAAASYSRSAPRYIGGRVDAEALSAYFAVLDAKYRRLPACVQVQLGKAIVRDRTIYVSDGEASRVVYETARAVDRPYVKLWDPSDLVGDAPVHAAGPLCIFLASAGSTNYGHWLIDDLPRAAWIADHRERLSIVIPSAGPQMDAVRHASLRLLIGEPIAARRVRRA